MLGEVAVKSPGTSCNVRWSSPPPSTSDLLSSALGEGVSQFGADMSPLEGITCPLGGLHGKASCSLGGMAGTPVGGVVEVLPKELPGEGSWGGTKRGVVCLYCCGGVVFSCAEVVELLECVELTEEGSPEGSVGGAGGWTRRPSKGTGEEEVPIGVWPSASPLPHSVTHSLKLCVETGRSMSWGMPFCLSTAVHLIVVSRSIPTIITYLLLSRVGSSM